VALLSAILEVLAAGIFSILISSELGGQTSNFGVLAALSPFLLTRELLITLLFLLFLGKLLFQLFELRIKNALSAQLYRKWFESWVNFPTKYRFQNPLSLFQRFSHYVIYPLAMIVSESIFLILFIPIAFIISFKGTLLITLVCLFTFLFISLFALTRLKLLNQIRSEIEQNFSSSLWDAIRQYEDLGQTSDRLRNDILSEFESTISADTRHVFWSSYPRFTVELTFILSVVVSLFYLDQLVPYQGRVQFFAIIGYGFFRLIPVFSRLISAYSQLKANVLELLTWYELVESVRNSNVTRQSFSGTVKYVRLVDCQLPWLVEIFGGKTISFQGWTLIKGESGIGKTTFLNLISKPKDITAKFLVNNETEVLNSDLGIMCGYVSQEPFISESSLHEISEIFSNYVNEKNVEAFAKILKVKANMFSGFSRGPLSGGQKKQIALIRALMLQPDVLILDEFPAGLDREKAITILKVLRIEFPSLSIIMTTHEVGFEKFFDQILTIRKH